jgi:hypothetical protein
MAARRRRTRCPTSGIFDVPRFALGHRVEVIIGYPLGIGTIEHVYGGPEDVQYRVLMDQRGEDGLRTAALVQEFQIVAADPIPPYTLLQRVTYQARGATITDIARSGDPDDPKDDLLYVLCDRDPPELWSGVEHEYIFTLPSWKLFAHTR